MQVVVDRDDVVARVKRYYVKAGIQAALAERQAHYEPDDFYRPIELVVSASNECRVLCRHCGLNTVAYGSPKARRLSTETIVSLLDQAAGEGFLSYLCSFEAEPFVNLPLLAEIVARFRGRLDPSKVNTSCSEFSSLPTAIALMRQLKRSGWADTSFLAPVVSLSLGLQQDSRNGFPVPLRNVIDGILGFHEVFENRREAGLVKISQKGTQ